MEERSVSLGNNINLSSRGDLIRSTEWFEWVIFLCGESCYYNQCIHTQSSRWKRDRREDCKIHMCVCEVVISILLTRLNIIRREEPSLSEEREVWWIQERNLIWYYCSITYSAWNTVVSGGEMIEKYIDAILFLEKLTKRLQCEKISNL